jgi:uncharacterized protein YecT (DUF1311 family)
MHSFTRSSIRILLCGAALWPALAAAQGDAGAAFKACMQRAGGVTASMHGCIGDDLRAQDQRLNAAYGALRNTLSHPRRSELQRAQRDWLRFRDSNCGFRLDPAGGTLAGVAAGDCKRRMTAERADELASLMPQR